MKVKGCSAVGLVVGALIFAQGAIGQTAQGPLRPEGITLDDASTPPPVKVMIGRNDVPQFKVAPPANFAKQPKTATFTISYLNAGEVNYYGDVCIGWPEDAKAAFTYAANIWGTLLNSSVPIKISACWANMGTDGLLGHGGARTYYRDFAGAPLGATFYPVAIANAIYGSDLNGGTEEIVIAYNAQFTDWYFGTDTCPADKIDFAQVIMHEMCHGLGFIGSMSVSSNLGYWGISDGSANYPVIYDRYTEGGDGTKLLAYSSGTAALYNQLVSGSVYFNGPNANAGNGGAKVPLYAPSTWSDGSSYAHLAQSFVGTVNGMMTYAADYGSTIHDPGPVTKGILADNGWNAANTIGPVIYANGVTNAITVAYPTPVNINVAMNAGGYAGTSVDWWVVVNARGGGWYCMNSAMQLLEFTDWTACQPILQSPLFTIGSTPVMSGLVIAPGVYDFWFAITYPMTGNITTSQVTLFDKVTVTVQ